MGQIPKKETLDAIAELFKAFGDTTMWRFCPFFCSRSDV